MANVIFRAGTRAQYDALASRDANTLYWLTDTQELRKGDFLFGIGRNATDAAAGLLSAEDKAKLDELVASGVSGLHAVDGSIVIGSDANGMTVGAQLSAVEGNILELRNDGLYVASPAITNIPEYELERMPEASEGFSATYKLKKTEDGTSTYVGDAVNIPRDLVVESGTVETVVVADEPYEGAVIGDKYIDLVIANTTSDHIYIPVNDLVDTYTAGDGITINNNTISVTNRTTQNLTGVNGTALIFNESGGGGAKFEHVDGTWSFVGVNDGGENGIGGQLYVVKQESDKYVGTRLNMTKDGFYYLPNSNSTAYTADDELATKGDIAAALAWQDI